MDDKKVMLQRDRAKIECDVCGREFTPKRSTARYCGDACKMRASRRKKDLPTYARTSVDQVRKIGTVARLHKDTRAECRRLLQRILSEVLNAIAETK